MRTVCQEVGQRIRVFRQRQGMTQEALAEKAELHHTYIGQVERGEKNLTINTLGKILSALGVSFSEIFENLEESVAADNIPAQCYQLICGRSKQEQLRLYHILLEIEQLMDK